METKVIELAKKLKALADRGIGGEKINAANFLETLMKKHNISFADIEGDKVIRHEYKYSGKDKKFCEQVISSVIELQKDGRYYTEYKTTYSRAKILIVYCTEAEYLLICAKIDFFWQVYIDELDIFYRAFIQKNKLYVKKSEEEPVKRDLTEKERERLRRVMMMYQTMDEHKMTPMLNEKNN